MKKIETLKEDQLEDWCSDLVKKLSTKTVVLLDGPLGAGKTLLVRKLVEALGGKSSSSPTYSLINYYQSEQYKKMYHIDLYRLEDDEDLESTGFWDLFTEDEGIIFIEWSEKLKSEDLPLDWKSCQIEITKSKDVESRNYKLRLE